VLEDGDRLRSFRLALVAVASVAVVAIVYLLAIRTHIGQRLDDVAFARRSVVTPGTTRRTDRLLGTISVASLTVMGGALVLLAFARRRVSLGIGAGVAMLGAVVTTEVLKHWVLTRPVFPDTTGVAYNTFPSGHATIGMVLSLGVVMVAPVHFRRLALIVGAFTATAFGTAVLASGWHRPSDTIGAYFVALAWFSAVSAVLGLFEQRSSARHHPRPEPAPSVPLLVTAAIGVFGLLMFVLWRSIGASGLHTVVYAAPYIAAVIGIDVAGVLVVGIFYVLDRTSAGRSHQLHTP
jgi:membrane-associated phospholipid phosphatase